ncbi:MAG: 2-amino-4-hydroxy-6-hydroxymethyldihydropteridine diphosphokinase, partial [Verrucomicrobia bacterium]|nr:2-amino-4-hydroxy-6-hydroxymethyldihydropteridine diphosphokinase [Verrucomicrobiota bacterium]
MNTYIALGSNLGNSEAEINRARDFLQTLAYSPVKCSSLWYSEPMDCPPGSPMFVNAVIGLELSAELSPVRLLDLLQDYEIRTGRPL